MDGIIPGDPPEPHQVAIDKVSTALLSPSSVDSDQKMSDSKDEDSEMSEYEEPEEPDNSMTLDEYQNGIWKETLASKVPQNQETPLKKGRVEKDGAEP